MLFVNYSKCLYTEKIVFTLSYQYLFYKTQYEYIFLVCNYAQTWQLKNIQLHVLKKQLYAFKEKGN